MFCALSCVREGLFRMILAWCMVLFITGGGAYGQAEQEKITLKVTNATVLDALHEVNRLSGNLVLFLKEEVERVNVRVSVDVKNLSLLETVKKIIEKTSLACVEKNGRVVVTPEERKPITVRGLVTDQRGHSLPGVTVRIKSLTLGTVTNEKGWYELSIPKIDDLVLVFSFIGMETVEVKYEGRDTLNVKMKEDVKTIEEVVVTGYGNVVRGNYTGAATTVKAADIMMAGGLLSIRCYKVLCPVCWSGTRRGRWEPRRKYGYGGLLPCWEARNRFGWSMA